MDGGGLSLWKMLLSHNRRVLIRSRPEGREMHVERHLGELRKQPFHSAPAPTGGRCQVLPRRPAVPTVSIRSRPEGREMHARTFGGR